MCDMLQLVVMAGNTHHARNGTPGFLYATQFVLNLGHLPDKLKHVGHRIRPPPKQKGDKPKLVSLVRFVAAWSIRSDRVCAVSEKQEQV